MKLTINIGQQAAPKFHVGDKVHCVGKEGKLRFAFDFVGTILNYSNRGENKHNQWEYEVTNAPLLFVGVPLRIWEHEIHGLFSD